MAVCVRCAVEFTAEVYWQRFCGDECRRAFHVEETKRGRELARRERAFCAPSNGNRVGGGMSDATRPYDNPADMKTKREVLQQDRAASTYLDQARVSIAELGGRFAHMAKETVVTGSVPFVHVPGQPATSYWGAGTRLPDEPKLGFSVERNLSDMETASGLPRVKADTGKVG
jgi:hypothetical protein